MSSRRNLSRLGPSGRYPKPRRILAAELHDPDFDTFPFYPCPFEQACTESNRDVANAVNGSGQSVLCASCLPGYYLSGMKPMQICQECPDRVGDTVTPELVVFISAILSFDGFRVRVCEPASPLRNRPLLIQAAPETLSLQLRLKDANSGDGTGSSGTGDAGWRAVKKESPTRVSAHAAYAERARFRVQSD